MRSLYIATILLLLLSGCRRKALEREMPLFIINAQEKLWLFNSITKDKYGKDLHMCALIVYDTLRTGSTVSCFTSIWCQKDSSFYFGKKSSQSSTLTNDKKFPLLVSIQGPDSSTNWLWQLTRNKMNWQAEIYPTSQKVTETFIHKTKYRRQYPFFFIQK